MNVPIVFVYAKDDKIKVLDLEKSKAEHDSLLADNWKHTATLNACVYIEYLYMVDNPLEILKELKTAK